jgi:hypothetical protein
LSVSTRSSPRPAPVREPTKGTSCRAAFRGLPTRVVLPWTGLAHRPSWRHHRHARAAVVLTGRAISVPF